MVGMSTHRNFAGTWLILAALVGVGSYAGSRPVWAAACIGPSTLEARVQAHPNSDAYATIGIWFDEKGDADCAIEAFQSGLKLEPNSARLNYLLGLSLYTAGRMQEAVAPLQESIRHHPEELKSRLLLGAALASLGRAGEAIPQWQAALKIDPGSKAALDGLARSQMASGDYEAAIKRLVSASRDENLTMDLASAYIESGMIDEAIHALADGQKAYPNSEGLTKLLESVYARQGRYEDATLLAKRDALRRPRDLEVQRTYLWMLVQNRDDELAGPLGSKLLALNPHNADLLYLKGVVEIRAGDYAAARKHLEEAVVLSPDRDDTRYELGVTLADLQDPAGARKQLEKAIELGATEPEVRFELVKVLRALGETDKAQEEFKIYRQRLTEKSDNERATLKWTEAVQAEKAGDKRKAAELYREACAAQPQNATLPYRLAQVLADLGDRAGQRAALEQAVKNDPSFVPAQYQLGYLDFQAGDISEAERKFRLTVDAAPGNAQAWFSLAVILGRELRFSEAQEAVKNALTLDPDNTRALEFSKDLAAAQSQK